MARLWSIYSLNSPSYSGIDPKISVVRDQGLSTSQDLDRVDCHFLWHLAWLLPFINTPRRIA